MQCEDCSFNVLGRSWGFLSVVVEGAGLVYVVEFVGRGRSGVVGARCGCLGCWGCGVSCSLLTLYSHAHLWSIKLSMKMRVSSNELFSTLKNHVHIHELHSAEYRCMVKVCVTCVGQRCVYMYMYITSSVHHQNDQEPGKIHITRFQCILLSVVCYAAQERQKAFRSDSPQNALHSLVLLQLLPLHSDPWANHLLLAFQASQA